MLRAVPHLVLALVLPALASSGCSGDAPSDVAIPARAEVDAQRSDDPRVVSTREALDLGRVDLARGLLEGLTEGGVEAVLLRARLAELEGDAVGAGRHIEEARRLAPKDARVYATAAELHASAGRLSTADEEIQRGLEACGPRPALERARAVYLLCSPGGAETGLTMLESALERDPSLPFTARALAQGHLLVGKRRMSAGDPKEAHRHATESLRFDPEERDARRFLAECKVAMGEFGPAIGLYEVLLAEGEPLEGELATLCKNAAIAALLQRERGQALKFFARARALGLTNDELGTGVHLLHDAAQEALDRSRDAWEAGEREAAVREASAALEHIPGWAPARAELARQSIEWGLDELSSERLEAGIAHLRAALEHEPGSLEARHFLAHALFRAGSYAEAADEWRILVDSARAEDLELPDPVHVDLAKALVLANRELEARNTLEEYLVLEPGGRWTDATRRALTALED